MSSVWIVLLDSSGSMGEGFSSPARPDPLAERGRWRTKLDAAKDLLLRQIAASRVQDVAVFRFSDDVEKLFQGARSNFSRAEATIRAVEPSGHTNLAGALAATTTDADLEGYRALSVLILSDGLANIGDPAAAADQLIAKFPFGRIDTILINDTEDGRQIAERVSINGSVRPASSSLHLGDALQLAHVSSLQQELAGFVTRRLQLQTELARIGYIPAPTLLTVTSPVELTTSSLRNDIVPTLEGVENLGEAASDATGVPYRAAITSISQHSPISISLTGLREAVELALNWVIPWRRENAQKLSKLKLRQQELENMSLENRVARECAEVEKARLENRQLEVEIANSKVALAERMLRHLDPNARLRGRRRQLLLQKLVHGVDCLSNTSIEFTASGPDLEQDNPPHMS